MTRTLAALTVSLLIAGAAAAAEIHGAWTAELRDNGTIDLQLSRHNNHVGETMNSADFTGLSPSATNFELRREAGTIAFEGTFKNSFGGGQFTFTPNPAYLATLRNLNVTFADGDDDRLMTMAVLDVSTSFIRALQAEGFRESGDKYVAMRIFKVTPEYVRDMRAAGYPDLSADELIASRIHKATPEFINTLKSLGYDQVPFDQLIAMRIHRVTPEFIRELKDAGYEHIPADKLVAMRIHGIDANFVKRMNAAK